MSKREATNSPGPKVAGQIFRFLKAASLAFFIWCGVIILLALLAPPMYGIKRNFHSAWTQSAHAIGLALFSFANDHDEKYPTGANSTEVCQQLLDGGYVSDPTIFYLPLPGKVKALPGQKLKPENVCWDFTADVNKYDPGKLPLMFMTGYKVTYAAGGAAVPIVKPYPHYFAEWQTWRDWQSLPDVGAPGIAVFTVDNTAKFALLDAASGTIPQFVAPDFDPKGKTFRQLTPDGALP